MLRRVAFVKEIEHFFGDNIGGFPEAFEHPEVFKDRGHDFAEASLAGPNRKRVDQRTPPGRFGRENVTGAFRGTKSWLSHEPSGYRRTLRALLIHRKHPTNNQDPTTPGTTR
jgi:hypothetical protein